MGLDTYLINLIRFGQPHCFDQHIFFIYIEEQIQYLQWNVQIKAAYLTMISAFFARHNVQEWVTLSV